MRNFICSIFFILIAIFTAKSQVHINTTKVPYGTIGVMKKNDTNDTVKITKFLEQKDSIKGIGFSEKGTTDTINKLMKLSDKGNIDSTKAATFTKKVNTDTLKAINFSEQGNVDSTKIATFPEKIKTDTIKNTLYSENRNTDSIRDTPIFEKINNDTIRLTKLSETEIKFLTPKKNDSLIITIKNLGENINSPFDEYAPVISADDSMLIFTSKQPIGKIDITKKQQKMENIYVSYYDAINKEWTKAKMLISAVNQYGRNNSAIALSNDGQRMLLYKGTPDGNIYSSILKGVEWSEPIKLSVPINSDKHESSASISPDGRTIYFVSDRKHGIGGKDIWFCNQDRSGQYGKAINMGTTINTTEDEEGVFIHPDGKTLYFSSKGHNSKGGYDVFKSVLINGNWSAPVSMGDAINTKGNDLFFVLSADGKKGYYSSTRNEGLGGKDIYEITFSYPENQNNESRLTIFKGVVIDYDTFETLESDIEITDNDKNEVITSIKSNSVSGKFLMSLPAGKNYGITVKKEGYLFYSENFNIPDSAAFRKIDKHVPLQKLNIGNKINLKNIFYDYGKSSLRPESIAELTQLLKLINKNPTIIIEIASYTDNEGTEEFNLNLSQLRAQSVVDFLFSAGIGREKLIAKGYGESDPLFSNDTEEGREINRRTEFKIINK